MSVMSSLRRATTRGKEEIAENKVRKNKFKQLQNKPSYQKLKKEDRTSLFHRIFQRKTG